ncbi:MAG: methyltransferase domain-containing protein [Anaerolineae bacterium]|nr:methyltransferase domain-containing protein [Anaerolineae bacterium]
MATVLMKWLETTPANYDRGIQLLTLGRLPRLKERIATDYIQAKRKTAPRVLEVGCGTGTLAILMAAQGARVTAIDVSAGMLALAEDRAAAAGLAGAVRFCPLNVTDLADHFAPNSFDVVVSTLAFSEFPPEMQRHVLQQVAQLLKPDGQLLIADEMVPAGLWARLIFWTTRLPLVILTWLLTRTTTTPLRHFSQTLLEAGFVPAVLESHLGGSLQLISARPKVAPEETHRLWQTYPQLHNRVTLKTLLLDLYSLLNRFIPPYPKIATGLYRLGHPDRRSLVLVTGNYELTVRRLVRELDGRVNCWLVVANSRGINVWCAAGGGHFTADDVTAALKTSGVMDVVDHHALILPQLCANGVDGWKIRQETGWGVHWGPVRAEDIPAYLSAGRKKSEAMRHVRFPLRARLEMTTIMVGLYGLIFAILCLIFWRPYTLLLLSLLVFLSYSYGIFLPWLPGRDGLEKGLTLTVPVLLGLWGWSLGWGHLPPVSLFNWSLGLGFLAFFIGGEFQGMSPLLRGEQANWSIEGLVGLGILAAYGVGYWLGGG